VSIAEISEKENKAPYDIMKELILKSNGGAGVIGFAMSEENVNKILAFPLTFVISDGWGQGLKGSDKSHPRNYGTFPRVLSRYVRERKTLALNDAIQKMTSMPAEHFQVKDRGVLQKGKFADITIFSYHGIMDKATFEKANQKPQGIEYVIVNGKVIINKGELTDTRAGRILRKV
jgi:N-acyl-D-amino-acid deacylase